MTLASIPNRPQNLDPENISHIIADFDAIINVINGGLDDANFQANTLSLSVLKASGASLGQIPVWNGSNWVPQSPGGLLAVVSHNPTSVQTVNMSSTTLTDIDGTNLITPSINVRTGKLLFVFEACTTGSSGEHYWGVREGAADIGQAKIQQSGLSVGYRTTMSLLITGLSIAAHTYKWAQRARSAVSVGTTWGTQASPAAADPGPATMSVWEVP